ncbi:HupE/UreJ family protein [uncultured Croceitalea sp.]|uniref:HupE/UreJ family protein n=1 Tax=uncultured Croceitalea sp. TaxID=1798908 RepID=UPI00374F19C8
MQDFWFYIKLGLEHVLDFAAYDHILFLSALAIPFTFKSWKQVVVLATVFTIAHCTSLAFSVYGILSIDVAWIEFLIPVTIALTAALNFFRVFRKEYATGIYFQILATTFFGLIHGFGFSNYFNMLMAEEENKLSPLLGFATGIEFSQILIILVILILAFVVQSVLKVKQSIFIGVTSILILLVTIPMLIDTFPN